MVLIYITHSNADVSFCRSFLFMKVHTGSVDDDVVKFFEYSKTKDFKNIQFDLFRIQIISLKYVSQQSHSLSHKRFISHEVISEGEIEEDAFIVINLRHFFYVTILVRVPLYESSVLMDIKFDWSK